MKNIFYYHNSKIKIKDKICFLILFLQSLQRYHSFIILCTYKKYQNTIQALYKFSLYDVFKKITREYKW